MKTGYNAKIDFSASQTAATAMLLKQAKFMIKPNLVTDISIPIDWAIDNSLQDMRLNNMIFKSLMMPNHIFNGMYKEGKAKKKRIYFAIDTNIKLRTPPLSSLGVFLYKTFKLKPYEIKGGIYYYYCYSWNKLGRLSANLHEYTIYTESNQGKL